MEHRKNYEIVSRFISPSEGWKKNIILVENVTYEQAGREASRVARELDKAFGNSHFWTVDLYNPTDRESGSYYQLFHGRLN